MSAVIEGGDERLIKAAHGTLLRVLKNVEPDYTVTGDLDRVVIESILRHGEHLEIHQINQERLDAFKFVCWIGGALINGIEKGAEEHQAEVIFSGLIKTLEELLLIDSNNGLSIKENTRKLLKSFLKQEYLGKPDHGIGMNGLYMAFHSCVECQRRGTKESGWGGATRRGALPET